MIGFRPAIDRDMAFIVSGWSSSYRTSYSAGMIAMEDWAGVMHPQIGKALARPGVRTIVAHQTDDPDPLADLQGFLTADTTVTPALVYYVYVKAMYRKGGIARALFHAMGVDPKRPFHYACKTPVVSELERKIPMSRFRPLEARFPKERHDRKQAR